MTKFDPVTYISRMLAALDSDLINKPLLNRARFKLIVITSPPVAHSRRAHTFAAVQLEARRRARRRLPEAIALGMAASPETRTSRDWAVDRQV